jgi:HEAT repeat protein
MLQYQSIGNDLFNNKKLRTIDLDDNNCPVYHCIAAGFTHPKLKPYLVIFNQGIVKQKEFILDTLKNDPDSGRRGAAAFLLGHLQDPHEIITTLSPYVEDPDPLVRNNVIRVIGETVERAKIYDFNLLPFLNLLASTESVDRNKSLFVIYAVAKSPAQQQKIMAYKDRLLDLLQLQQPNNHKPAYMILTRISGKKFGEYDLVAWKNWANTQQRVISPGII